MRLTTFSDYTMRVLIYLGLQHDRLVTISEIAKAYGISENHLMKVVHQLAVHGHIETVRGKGGGLRLRRAPDQINLGAIVHETETTSLLECMDAENVCRIQPACKLMGILQEAQDALYAVLDKYTLADLLHKEEPLAQILEVSR